MATSIQISLGEYLHTSYRPDREYIDGEVRERNVGKWEHARLQALLASWFARNESSWNIMASTELRVQVFPTRVRIPDVTVVTAGPQPDVLIDPPLLVVEILSPDDTYSDTQERASDYLKMGVSTIWIIDPCTRSGRMGVQDTWKAASRLELPGTPIYVDLPELFQYLDKPVV